MSTETVQADLSSLINPMIDLAGEMDGVADLGMVACLLKEEEVAGRHARIAQHCEKIRLLVNSISSALSEGAPLPSRERSALQAELIAGTELFLNAFQSLEGFRRLNPGDVRSLTEAVCTGWEAIHRAIRRIAETLDLLDQSWYLAILERQDTYRTQLHNYCSAFHQEVSPTHAE